ncbi:DOPA-like domain-containing protein [Peziza echinospora]|nr:DOPA-like domain-containing protein [Peziza echinospora]
MPPMQINQIPSSTLPPNPPTYPPNPPPYPSPLTTLLTTAPPDPQTTLTPLPTTLNPLDNHSFLNPPRPATSPLHPSYAAFPPQLQSGTTDAGKPRAAWDVHVYWREDVPEERAYAVEFWEVVRREFPELRIYPLRHAPIGPHLLPMFEVNLFTPAQFGAFVPWFAMNRGPLRALVHPNTWGAEKDVGLWDHTVGAIWIGGEVGVDTGILEEAGRRRREMERGGK